MIWKTYNRDGREKLKVIAIHILANVISPNLETKAETVSFRPESTY